MKICGEKEKKKFFYESTSNLHAALTLEGGRWNQLILSQHQHHIDGRGSDQQQLNNQCHRVGILPHLQPKTVVNSKYLSPLLHIVSPPGEGPDVATGFPSGEETLQMKSCCTNHPSNSFIPNRRLFTLFLSVCTTATAADLM